MTAVGFVAWNRASAARSRSASQPSGGVSPGMSQVVPGKTGSPADSGAETSANRSASAARVAIRGRLGAGAARIVMA